MKTRFLKGNEITPKDIRFIKNILRENLLKEDYYDECKNIYDINDLSKYDETSIENERLVISYNWYLRYIVEKDKIFLLEWYSSPKETSVKRSIEMLNIIKNILLTNKDKIFYGCLIHITSYRLYQLMIKKGLIEEIENDRFFCKISNKKEQNKFKSRINEKYPNLMLKNILNDPEIENDEILRLFIYHDVVFEPTAAFFEKYGKENTKKLRK